LPETRREKDERPDVSCPHVRRVSGMMGRKEKRGAQVRAKEGRFPNRPLRFTFRFRNGGRKRRSLIIQFVKQNDGSVVLRCARPDGSSTWQRVDDQHAAFFPLHDLTHYAVETELGFRRGFYGLIAEGWDIAETTGKTARGALPNETLEVEYLVSAFSAERSGGVASQPRSSTTWQRPLRGRNRCRIRANCRTKNSIAFGRASMSWRRSGGGLSPAKRFAWSSHFPNCHPEPVEG
jgi:hypothetical protein